MRSKADDNEVQGLALAPPKKMSVPPADFVANYYPVMLSEGKSIHEYLATFSCDVGLRYRARVLKNHKEFGVIATDGTHLYSPNELSPSDLKFKFTRTRRGDDAEEGVETVTLKKTKEIKSGDPDIWRVLNIVKGDLMREVDLKQLGRNYFRIGDSDGVTVPGVNNITFFPGITASIVPIQTQGAAIVVDVLYKAIRKDTALDLIEKAKQEARRGVPVNELILERVRGISVITMYSKRNYVIDDVAFGMTPADTFEWKPSADKPAKRVSYAEYISERYRGSTANTRVTDVKQPMLVVNRKNGEKTYLIPELCRLTGLPDELRRNFTAMKSIAEVTHPVAPKHAAEIRKYAADLSKGKRGVEYMRPWNMALASDMLPVKGAILPPPKILVGRGRSIPGISEYKGKVNPDFTFSLMKSPANVAANLSNWVCVVPQDRDGAAESFVFEYLIPKLRNLGGRIEDPEWLEYGWTELGNARRISEIIARDVLPMKPEFALFVLTNDNADTYNIIKRTIYDAKADVAFPTQVVKAKTIGNPKKVQGVSNKVALQVVAKLGGVGYSVDIAVPALREGTMVIGVDVCHKGSGFKAGDKHSVVGLVASVDNSFVRCWAEPRIQEHRKEVVTDLVPFVQNALGAYKKKNSNRLPKQIIVYRDGVSDGELDIVLDEEVVQFEEAFRRTVGADRAAWPKLVYVVVKKNTNTRLFSKGSLDNPQPGSVVDSGITHNGWYEFFLVPHVANQGMVSPTNFVVVRDELKLDPVALQTFTYHQCFIYQNWSGSIKVPAMCQNAHKLAYLVGENIAGNTNKALADKQFFL